MKSKKLFKFLLIFVFLFVGFIISGNNEYTQAQSYPDVSVPSCFVQAANDCTTLENNDQNVDNPYGVQNDDSPCAQAFVYCELSKGASAQDVCTDTVAYYNWAIAKGVFTATNGSPSCSGDAVNGFQVNSGCSNGAAVTIPGAAPTPAPPEECTSEIQSPVCCNQSSDGSLTTDDGSGGPYYAICSPSQDTNTCQTNVEACPFDNGVQEQCMEQNGGPTCVPPTTSPSTPEAPLTCCPLNTQLTTSSNGQICNSTGQVFSSWCPAGYVPPPVVPPQYPPLQPNQCYVPCNDDEDGGQGEQVCAGQAQADGTCQPNTDCNSQCIPVPPPSPNITPGVTPGVPPPPGVTITPPTPITPTSTPAPEVCKCDGIQASGLFPGQPAQVTINSEVVGSNPSLAEVPSVNMYLTQLNGSSGTGSILLHDTVPATQVSGSAGEYQSVWNINVPANLDPNATYALFAQTPITCEQVSQPANTNGNSNDNANGGNDVLGASTQNISWFQSILNFFTGLFGKKASVTVVSQVSVTPTPQTAKKTTTLSSLQLKSLTPGKKLSNSTACYLYLQFPSNP